MKRLALVLLVLVAAAPAVYGQQFVANLAGTNEVPPADLDGNGTALVTIAGTTVSYEIVVNNIAAPTAQHIHSGVAGVNGPIVVGLTGTWSGSGNGPWTLVGATTTDAATAAAIVANPAAFYVNVHNADFPGGAVRGQLAAFAGNIPTASTMGLFALIAAMAVAGLLIMRRV
jgi:hypothetical protein